MSLVIRRGTSDCDWGPPGLRSRRKTTGTVLFGVSEALYPAAYGFESGALDVDSRQELDSTGREVNFLKIRLGFVRSLAGTRHFGSR